MEGMNRTIPKLPGEYKGKVCKKDKYKRNNARLWTKEEEEWCLDLRSKGFNTEEIAFSVDREPTSVSLKMKRLTKKNDTYNKKHIVDKYETNKEYYLHLQPKTILDVYCGVKSYWRNNTEAKCVTNDKDINVEADYHLDALKFLCKNYLEGKKYDVVDLDPFGTSYDCLDLAIKMANKGLIVTLGEMGHKRFKRLDFVRRAYGIDTLNDFTSENIIKEIQRIGLVNKKILNVYVVKDWQGISRVWFTIEKHKSTEQWGKFAEEVDKVE